MADYSRIERESDSQIQDKTSFMSVLATTRYIGRLGNNMFQTAALIGYARKYGVKWACPAFNKETPDWYKYFPNLPKGNYPFRSYSEHQPIHDKDWFNYHEIPFQPNGTTLVGFFQSEKYFEHCKEEVKEVFKLPHTPGYEDYVSIHVRRGDYVQHSGSFPPITVDYVNKAIREIESRIGNWPKVIFFSDDIQWCKDNFRPFSHVEIYSEGRTPIEDLALMASCGHHIIANSSFSWWGAYLGHNPNKIVVSPSHKRGNWFGMDAGVKHDCIDLIPKEWIQIEFR